MANEIIFKSDKYQNLLNNGLSYSITVSNNKNIIDANNSFLDEFGFKLNEIIGQNIQDLIPNIIIIRIYSHKKNGVGKVDIKEIMHYTVLVILFVICFFIASLNLGVLLSGLILLIIIGLYIIFLFTAKIFSRNDIDYIFDIINPKKMINYIRDETMKETEEEK